MSFEEGDNTSTAEGCVFNLRQHSAFLVPERDFPIVRSRMVCQVGPPCDVRGRGPMLLAKPPQISARGSLSAHISQCEEGAGSRRDWGTGLAWGIWSQDPAGWVFTVEGWCAYSLGSMQCAVAVRPSRIMEKASSIYVQIGIPREMCLRP